MRITSRFTSLATVVTYQDLKGVWWNECLVFLVLSALGFDVGCGVWTWKSIQQRHQRRAQLRCACVVRLLVFLFSCCCPSSIGLIYGLKFVHETFFLIIFKKRDLDLS